MEVASISFGGIRLHVDTQSFLIVSPDPLEEKAIRAIAVDAGDTYNGEDDVVGSIYLMPNTETVAGKDVNCIQFDYKTGQAHVWDWSEVPEYDE